MNIIQVDWSWNGSLTYGNHPEYIVVHHAEAQNCTVQQIDSWHKDRGWVGIGYHLFVRKDGSIYQGRPFSAWGAHCPGANERSIGICVEGEYDSNDRTMPTAQFNALVEVCKYLKAQFGISTIYRHRDLYSTACPGQYFPYNQLLNGSSSSTPVNVINTTEPVINRDWLQVGDQGPKVSELQNSLNKLGFDCGTADGSYGKLTKNAVYAFQHKYGLQEDGLAGKQVFAKLAELTTSVSTSVGNEKVRSIQHLCNQLSIKGNNGQALTEDGLYGPNTEYAIKQLPVASMSGSYHNELYTKWLQTQLGISSDGIFYTASDIAVKAFQQKYKLDVDGAVGFNTLKTLLFN